MQAQEVLLPPGGLVLGRSANADLILQDDSVSRRHARIGSDPDGWFVKDMGSLNGIRVNGEDVRDHRLSDRDLLVIGRSDLVFLARDDDEYSRHDQTGPLRRAFQGRYQIERQLGAGAQADVYLAETPEGRTCAVKVLSNPDQSGTGDVRRFQREARALMSLRHPNIVEILEVDEAEGFNFMALEFLGGGSLEDRLDERGRLSWTDALRLLKSLAEALLHAHARGIYHRDIKPANILFREDGSAVLTDFGIAQILETSRLTRTGMVFGTPFFMSPSRLSGEPASDHSDVYALGATVFVSLTEQYPFPGADVEEIVRTMKQGEALPANLLEPTVPAPLANLLGKILRRGPRDRIESAGELLREIGQLPDPGGPAVGEESGSLRATRFAYLTDLGQTYVAEDLETQETRMVKYVGPTIGLTTDFNRRSADLAESDICEIRHWGHYRCLVNPAVPGRTLSSIATEARLRTGYPLPEGLAIARAVADALQALPVPHGDVHPNLTMITSTGEIRLLDPGFAYLLEDAAYANSRRHVSRIAYTAPEMLLGGPPTDTSDAFGFGALLFWILTGVVPLSPGPLVERIERLMMGRFFFDAAEELPAALQDLLASLLKVKPAARSTLAEASAALAEASAVAAPSTVDLARLVASPATVLPELIQRPRG